MVAMETDTVLQQYHNEVSTLVDQLRGARDRQMRVLLEKLDDSRQLRQRLLLLTLFLQYFDTVGWVV